MRKTFKLILLSQAALLIPALIGVGVNAAPRLVEENKKQVQQATQQLGAATSRSVEQMLADQKLAEQGMKAMPATKPIPFRAKDQQKYEYLKKNAQGQAKAAKGREGAQTPLAPLAPPILRGINFDGVNRTTAGGWFPPDTHGAAGNSHFVEVTNSHVDMYRKSNQALEKSVTLNAFFGYFEQSLFDPRCIYDPDWDRFIITAEAFEEVDGDQWHFIAISRTANALGAYWIYAINVGALYGNFWDFPQLGMTQDALIITAHLFDSSDNFVESGMMTFAKARVYNGLGVTFAYWGGLLWNLTPPIVRDQDEFAALVCADGYSGNLGLNMYYLENAENPFYVDLWGPYFVDTADFSIPPNAPQPGTAELLHTSDCRFVNASTQIGYNLYQIHSVDFGGAACKWYQIDWMSGTVITDNTFWTSSFSADFNASIAANDFNDVYVTWTSVDAAALTNAQVRISGRRSFDAPTIGAGTALFTSPTFLSGNPHSTIAGVQRWGDYSAVSIDPSPANQLRAWIVNEKINTNTAWGSRIARIGF